VRSIAHTIASNAPLSVAASKLAIDQVLLDPQERDFDALARASTACFDSADYKEGRAAFLEKRSPQFQGR
jgi:enoyl-CoA hydratase